jgi:hypothetical protein
MVSESTHAQTKAIALEARNEQALTSDGSKAREAAPMSVTEVRRVVVMSPLVTKQATLLTKYVHRGVSPGA